MRLGLVRPLSPTPRSPQGGTLWIVGETGRAGRLAWRADRPDECTFARSVFDSMLRKGYRAFVVGPNRPARSIAAFEPALAQLMLVPGPAGGWEDCDAAAWTASIDEARTLVRRCLGALLSKPGDAPPPQRTSAHETLRERRELLAALLHLLSRRQRQQLRESGDFYLTGGASGIRYRLRTGVSANVDQLDESGAVQYRLHVLPACELPLAGQLLMQLLCLQDAETEHSFLAAAQVFPAESPPARC